MQNLLIRCLDPAQVVLSLESYPPDEPVTCTAPTNWPSEPSYPTTLKISPLRQDLDEGPDFRRYWASKRSDGGKRLEYEWLLIADKHDALDLRAACFLSRELATTALAVHASEGTDEYGWCSYRQGELVSQYFREVEERPVYRVDEELENRGIPYKLCRFRSCSGPGWRTVDLSR